MNLYRNRNIVLPLLLILSAAAFATLAQSGTETDVEQITLPACDNLNDISEFVSGMDARLVRLADHDDVAAALKDIYEVGKAYQALALTCGYLPADFSNLVIDTTDLTRVLPALELLYGDPGRGQLLYDGEEATVSGDKLSCFGCHEASIVAPPTAGTWTRWDEQHSLEERFADYDFTHYTVESILLPREYFVPTYPEYTMPDLYAEQLSYQDLADLIAYLESQDQLPED